MAVNLPVHVLGGGGHAKVVISTLLAAGFEIAAVYDDAEVKWGQTCLGFPIQGPLAALPTDFPVSAVIALGDNHTRRTIAQRFPTVQWLTVVHPHAWVHTSVVLGAGTVVFAGAVIQPETRIGSHCIINTGASVDHDCRLGDFVHLAPGTHLAGEVEIRDGALLGIGSVVLPGRRIGEWAIVGAGGGVVQDLPERCIAIGVPARVREEMAQ